MIARNPMPDSIVYVVTYTAIGWALWSIVTKLLFIWQGRKRARRWATVIEELQRFRSAR